MSVASRLAEALGSTLPARAPGVPAWPSSFLIIRAHPCIPWFQIKIAKILKAGALPHFQRLFQRLGQHHPDRISSSQVA